MECSHGDILYDFVDPRITPVLGYVRFQDVPTKVLTLIHLAPEKALNEFGRRITTPQEQPASLRETGHGQWR